MGLGLNRLGIEWVFLDVASWVVMMVAGMVARW